MRNYLCRETSNENKQFKEIKTWISSSYVIRKTFLNQVLTFLHGIKLPVKLGTVK